MAPIQFAYEETAWRLDPEAETAGWLGLLAKHHGYDVMQLTYIFCTDDYLLRMNREHLQHDEFTDILTFDYGESARKLMVGDIFISVDRVRENADLFKSPFIDELHRVMAHGLLHLVGFNDTTQALKKEMRRQEDFALNLRMF